MYARASVDSGGLASARSSGVSTHNVTAAPACFSAHTHAHAVRDVALAAPTPQSLLSCDDDNDDVHDAASPSWLPSLRARSVFVFGLRDTAGLLERIAHVLARVCERVGRRGAVVAAFRLPRTPPPGVVRPVYDTALLLVVLDSAAAARQLAHGDGDGGGRLRLCDGTCVTVRRATTLAVSSAMAEQCLRTFACNATTTTTATADATPRSRLATTTSPSTSPPPRLLAASTRLWSVVLSSVSTYAVDWAAAATAAARGDAVVIDEREVLLAYAMCSGDNGNERRAVFASTSGDDAARSSSSNSTYNAAGLPRRAYADGDDMTRRHDRSSSSTWPSTAYGDGRTTTTTMRPGMAAAAETVQHRYYRERYGVRDGDAARDVDVDDGVCAPCGSSNRRRRSGSNYAASSSSLSAWLSRQTMTQLWRALTGSSAATRDDYDDDDDNDDSALPRQRRCVDGAGGEYVYEQTSSNNNNDNDDDSALSQLPRLGSVAASLVSLPGFRYVLPLLRRGDERNAATTTAAVHARPQQPRQPSLSSSSRPADDVAWDETTLSRRFATTTAGTTTATRDGDGYATPRGATPTATVTATTAAPSAAASDATTSRSAVQSLLSFAAPLQQWLTRLGKRTRSSSSSERCDTAAVAALTTRTAVVHDAPRLFVFGQRSSSHNSHNSHDNDNSSSSVDATRRRRGQRGRVASTWRAHTSAPSPPRPSSQQQRGTATASSSSSDSDRHTARTGGSARTRTPRAPTRIRVLSVVSPADDATASTSPRRARAVNFRLPDEAVV